MYFRKKIKSHEGFFLIFNEFDISDRLSMSHQDSVSKSFRDDMKDDLRSLSQIDEIDELSPTIKSYLRNKF